ncbi:unnamed protein product [Strongylus vulgaris]|uniref:Nematode cuticle collagen N-terminal domain-containing protein n=1 Tax=Strongylus vulgaris TaxID=40348 RepID=A0A3P7JGI5_STRVU|nr:unnamed protein product [Strongylus vulgaris]
MDTARSSSYIAIGLSTTVVITTMAYIPYMLMQIDSVLDSIKVHNDEFEVMEIAVRMEFKGLREDAPRKRRQTEGLCTCSSSNDCPSGAKGMPGVSGQDGDPEGSAGKLGEVGPPGNDGIRGEKGPVGDKGQAGEAGPKGPPGYSGRDGGIGSMGPPGPPGQPGSPGNPGFPGPMGPPSNEGGPGEDASYCKCPSRKAIKAAQRIRKVSA